MSYKYRKGDSVLVMELAKGLTIRDAAKLAGISEKTVYRRLKDQKFRAEVGRIRMMYLREAAGKLAASSTEAASILLELAKKAEAEYVRRSAAADVLTLGMRLLELGELSERLTQLEEMMKDER